MSEENLNKKFEEEFNKLSEKDKRKVKNLIRFMHEKKYHDSQYEELLNQYIELSRDYEKSQNIIKEVREYITSYESIETIQQFDHNKNNKDLDYSTIDEMTRRYMIVHDKILEILDKEKKL